MNEITQIRQATMNDVPMIAPLLEQLGYPSTEEQIRSRLEVMVDHPDYSTWIAEQGESVVGLIGAHIGYAYGIDGCVGQITAVVVDAQARGQGIGTKMIHVAEDWVREKGGTRIFLNSGRDRLEAHQLYERLGYSGASFCFGKNLGPNN